VGQRLPPPLAPAHTAVARRARINCCTLGTVNAPSGSPPRPTSHLPPPSLRVPRTLQPLRPSCRALPPRSPLCRSIDVSRCVTSPRPSSCSRLPSANPPHRRASRRSAPPPTDLGPRCPSAPPVVAPLVQRPSSHRGRWRQRLRVTCAGCESAANRGPQHDRSSPQHSPGPPCLVFVISYILDGCASSPVETNRGRRPMNMTGPAPRPRTRSNPPPHPRQAHLHATNHMPTHDHIGAKSPFLIS